MSDTLGDGITEYVDMTRSGVLLADLRDEERAHAGARAAAHGVDELEALEAVAGLGLLAHDVEDRVDELGALRVVALGPVVARARLAEDEVVRAEELAEGARADGVHGAGLEVHEDGARHVAAARRLVVVDVDALELEVRVAVVRARRVDAVLVGDDLPELGADLVAALAALDVDDLAHGCLSFCLKTCGARRFILPALLLLGLPCCGVKLPSRRSQSRARAWGGVRRLGASRARLPRVFFKGTRLSRGKEIAASGCWRAVADIFCETARSVVPLRRLRMRRRAAPPPCAEPPVGAFPSKRLPVLWSCRTGDPRGDVPMAPAPAPVAVCAEAYYGPFASAVRGGTFFRFQPKRRSKTPRGARCPLPDAVKGASPAASK